MPAQLILRSRLPPSLLPIPRIRHSAPTITKEGKFLIGGGYHPEFLGSGALHPSQLGQELPKLVDIGPKVRDTVFLIRAHGVDPLGP